MSVHRHVLPPRDPEPADFSPILSPSDTIGGSAVEFLRIRSQQPLPRDRGWYRASLVRMRRNPRITDLDLSGFALHRFPRRRLP
jgi:hypothetical protein